MINAQCARTLLLQRADPVDPMGILSGRLSHQKQTELILTSQSFRRPHASLAMGFGLHYPNNPRGELAINVSTAFTIIATVIVALRLYTRFALVRYVGIEDFMIIAAMLGSIGLTICIGFQASWGLGLHGHELNQEDMVISLKAFWASLIVYYLSLGLTKAALLLQYRRIFTNKRFSIASWCIMAVVIAYTIWTVFGSIFACVPVRAFWTKEPATCIDQFAMWFTNAAINILTDFAIIILPMPVIRSLNLARRQKQALLAIFAVGGAVCVVSILRLQSLVKISNSKDPTYDNPPAASWSSVETNVGIICSCLPLLRPLMTRYLPHVFTSYKRSTRAPTGGTAPQLFQTGHTVHIATVVHHDDDDEFEMTRAKSPISGSNLPGSDIQIVTNIQVKVEGRECSVSEWNVPVSERVLERSDRVDTVIGMSRLSSTETLVKDKCDMV